MRPPHRLLSMFCGLLLRDFRYIKATDGQELVEGEVRGLLEGHVTIRHINVKGHFAFVELEDTPR